MSNRLVVELPESNILSAFGSITMSLAGVFALIGSLITLGILLSPETPVVVKTGIVFAIILTTVIVTRQVLQIITQNRWKRAEYALKTSIKRLGYVALEPIEITGKHARALIKDHFEPALWEVNVERTRVVCEKIPQMKSSNSKSNK